MCSWQDSDLLSPRLQLQELTALGLPSFHGGFDSLGRGGGGWEGGDGEQRLSSPEAHWGQAIFSKEG